MPSIENCTESTRLTRQAIALLLSDSDGFLEEVESLLRRALELWEDNIDALEEVAHFYDSVMDDAGNAVHYATLCRAKAAALVTAMDEILSERGATGGGL